MDERLPPSFKKKTGRKKVLTRRQKLQKLEVLEKELAEDRKTLANLTEEHSGWYREWTEDSIRSLERKIKKLKDTL